MRKALFRGGECVFLEPRHQNLWFVQMRRWSVAVGSGQTLLNFFREHVLVSLASVICDEFDAESQDISDATLYIRMRASTRIHTCAWSNNHVWLGYLEKACEPCNVPLGCLNRFWADKNCACCAL